MRLFAGTEFDIPPRCDRCGALEEECACPPPEPPARIPPAEQTARVRQEKRKRGKVVTLVAGLCPEGNDLPALLTTLKNACGAGGTLKEDVLEIQGAQQEAVGQALRDLGYRIQAR